jgi:hypothetical protein
MKNALVVLYCLLFYSLLNAQQIVPLPDSNAVWSVYDEKYFVSGDSVFDGKKYSKFYLTNDSIVSTGSFFSMVRQDSTNGRVYAVAANDSAEHLLYDFMASVSDTIVVYPLSFMVYSGPVRVKIDSIDSVLLADGNYYKRLKVSGVDNFYPYDEYWVEGVGSTFGLFNPGLSGMLIFDITYPMLFCFEKEGDIIYDNPLFSTCYAPYPSGIRLQNNDMAAELFPNPVSDILSLRLPQAQDLQAYDIVITHSTGKTVFSQKSDRFVEQIDVSAYAAGIYVVSVQLRFFGFLF